MDLPIEPLLPDLLTALAQEGRAVLQAPPGAGKTTRVPLALLGADWRGDGKIVMLEPRRIAARAAAQRMAAQLGEAVGETIGYRVRLDSKVSAKTRVEVVTEGLFLRQIQDDPELAGVAAVLFDEFHERNADSDLALALVLETRAALRDDLRLLVMSATLDGAGVAALLDAAPLLTSDGRAHPVETRYLGRPDRLEPGVAAAVRQALREEAEGDLLVFLPGTGEIRRTAAALEGSLPETVDLLTLAGELSFADQDRALRAAASGRRKVVLSTAIAETSVTLDGTRIVIDAGLSRRPSFDPATGMSRLETVRVSAAAAEQRRGRAGRQRPGVCYRLWAEAEQRGLLPFHPPEIESADLAPLALELASWGAEAKDLRWLTPPPAPALARARALLADLGALGADGRITPHGQAMTKLGAHPRLAHLMLKGREMGDGALACLLAALLGDRDPIRPRGGARSTDLIHRLDLLIGAENHPDLDRKAAAAIRQQATQFRRQIGVRPDERLDTRDAGRLLALAYPDRIAQRRGPPGQFRLSSGQGALLLPDDPQSTAPLLAVASLDGDRANARIFVAAPLTEADVEALFPSRMEDRDSVSWDKAQNAVAARRQRRFGALVFADKPIPNPPADLIRAGLLDGIRQIGLHCLPWSDAAETLRQRVAFARRTTGEDWPDWSDDALLATLEDWLGPHLDGRSRLSHLDNLPLAQILREALPWDQQRALDRLAPTHIDVPTGSQIAVDYSGDEPVLAVRLQEMFGLAETPRLGDGRAPVLLHLLSPARRPLAVTRDLAGFWKGAYADVRKDMRGQYPRHVWPEDPLAADPTTRTKKALDREAKAKGR